MLLQLGFGIELCHLHAHVAQRALHVVVRDGVGWCTPWSARRETCTPCRLNASIQSHCTDRCERQEVARHRHGRVYKGIQYSKRPSLDP